MCLVWASGSGVSRSGGPRGLLILGIGRRLGVGFRPVCSCVEKSVLCSAHPVLKVDAKFKWEFDPAAQETLASTLKFWSGHVQQYEIRTH